MGQTILSYEMCSDFWILLKLGPDCLRWLTAAVERAEALHFFESASDTDSHSYYRTLIDLCDMFSTTHGLGIDLQAFTNIWMLLKKIASDRGNCLPM